MLIAVIITLYFLALDFPPVQTGPGAHPASCTMGTGFFPGVKCGRGVVLTTHPLLALRSWKSKAIPLYPYPPLGHNRACNGVTLSFFTSGRTLGISKQRNVLTDIGENWTEKCFRIVAVRPANRCSECWLSQPAAKRSCN